MIGRKVSVSPLMAGLVLGFGAALVQAFFRVVPPVAYGVCLVCHPKDLVNWLAERLVGLDWPYSLISTTAPLLTVVGVMLGSLAAAWQHGEFRLRSPRQPLVNFVNGFLMINAGLFLGSCPIRIVLLSAYGNLIGVVGWVCVVLGVVAGTVALRWTARRAILREASA